MTINGKRDGFTRADIKACANAASLKRGRAEAIFDEVRVAVLGFVEHATRVGIGASTIAAIAKTHRLDLAAA